MKPVKKIDNVFFYFSQSGAGFIEMFITVSDRRGTSPFDTISVYASFVFDPFPKLIKLFEDMTEQQVHSSIDIDGEGNDIELFVDSDKDDPDILHFRVVRDYERSVRFIANKNAIIDNFLSNFDEFVKNHYVNEQWKWEDYVVDLREIPLQKLHRYIEEHKD